MVTRWHGIIKIVCAELTSLNLQRQFMQDATDVVNGNERFLHHPGRRFMDYTRDWYVNSMAAAYRRQTDPDRNSASLRVLLEEIKAQPTAYRLDTLRPFMQSAADAIIENFVMSVVGAVGNSGPDLAIVQTDLDALTTTGDSVRKFVNKHVAHTDIKAQTNPIQPTFDDLHAAAIACERIAKRWRTALTGASGDFDVVTQYGWKDVFDFPWRARKPNDEPEARKYIVTVHPCLDVTGEDAWFESVGATTPEQREAVHVKQVAAALGIAKNLKPAEAAGGLQTIPNILSIERLI